MSEQRKWTEEQRQTYYQLMEEIQQVDFVLVELNLYLDTHPTDHKAINQYNEFTQRSMALKSKFQSLFGPLTHFGHSFSTYPWTWEEAPWPWQV